MSMTLEDRIAKIIKDEYAPTGFHDEGRSDSAAHNIIALLRSGVIRDAIVEPPMTLRDWFAGLAMQGIWAAGVPSDATFKDIAEKAYRAADSMLKERER